MKTNLIISNAAEKQLTHIFNTEPKGTFLRIYINNGGCSGFQYYFNIDNITKEKDVEISLKTGKIVIDDLSLSFIKGSTLDYVENMIGTTFTLKNPNASSSCGCGVSFSI